ncbi:helix-turn-helix domain-containing protein [Kribbella sp. NPDC055071]
MPQELYSVEQVANRLGLHVRTIRNYVRDGRLKAVRIGKQYRIAREDLEAFTGTSAAALEVDESSRHVEASSIVHIDAVDRAGADRISTHVNGSVDRIGHLRVETVYDEDRAVLKIIIFGDLAPTAGLLHLIDLMTKA